VILNSSQKLNLKGLPPLAEDFKESQATFCKDELGRELRRSGKLKQDPIETSCERLSEDV